MVQKYQSPVRVYEYPWELVMAAYERRWPTCKFIPILISSDTIFEEKSDDGARHVIERRCKMKVDVPYLLRKVAGVDFLYFVQRNAIDHRARTLDIEAWNETFENRIKVREHCLYTAHPENPSWTSYTQEASLEIVSFFGFESAVEKLAIKQYTANIQKSKEILLHFIDELSAEGITYLPPYEENQGGKSTDGTKEHASASPTGDAPASNAGTSGAVTPREIMPSSSGYKSQRSDSIRMEENYILKCLGALDPAQESSLIQLKQWLEEHHKLDKIPNDAHLVRFLRARNFDIESTTKMLCKSLMWRKQNGVDRLRTSWHAPEVAVKYFPGGWLADNAHDREGRPVYMLRVGQMDIKGLLKSMGAAELEKFVVYTCEEGLEKYVEATRLTGHPVSSAAVIVDLYGLSTRHLWRPGLQFLRQLFMLLNENYPETLGRLWVVRAPRFFPVLWTLVSPFIDEETHKKLVVYAGNTHLHAKDGLENYIARQYLPPFLLEKTDFSSDTSLVGGGGMSSSQSSHGLTPEQQQQQQPLAAASSSSSVAESSAAANGDVHVSPSHNNNTLASTNSSTDVPVASSSSSTTTVTTPTQQRRKRSLKATLSGSRQEQQAAISGRASTPNTPTTAGGQGGPPSLALDAHIPLGGLVPRSYYLVDAENAVVGGGAGGWTGGGADSGPPSASTPTTVDKAFVFNPDAKLDAGGGGVSATSSLTAESGIGSSCYSSPAGSSDCSDEALASELLNSAIVNGATPTKHNPAGGLASNLATLVRPSSSGGAGGAAGTMLLGHTTKSWVPMHFTNRTNVAVAVSANSAASGAATTGAVSGHFEPLYVRVLLSRTGEHEVPLEITQPGSIVTWDFDVLGSNCRFSILYLHFENDNRNYADDSPPDTDDAAPLASVDHLEPSAGDKQRQQQPPVLSAERQKQQEKLNKCVHQYYEQLQQRQAEKQQKQTGKSQHDSAGSSVVIGASMPYQERGDVDAVRFVERVGERLPHLKVEKIFEKDLCKNGDSIQGTCNAKHAGVYVLRWRQIGLDASCVPSTSLMATTFDSLKLSVGSPRCKLMYSVEVITRDSWKGSMNSLHAFSSINLQPPVADTAVTHDEHDL